MKHKTSIALMLCLALALAGGTMAFAQENPDAISADGITASPDTAEVSAEEAPVTPETSTQIESEDVPETEQSIKDVYNPEKVILSSTAWSESLGECVTGEFGSIADALLAVNSEIPLYYPSWDAGHLETFGGAMLIILHNPVSVLDPATGASSLHPSLQFNYKTPQLDYFKIHFGYTDKYAPEGECEPYAFGDYTFYLSAFENVFTGGRGCIAYATIEGCGYTFVTDSFESAKTLINSLVRA